MFTFPIGFMGDAGAGGGIPTEYEYNSYGDTDFVVPVGITHIWVKMWGAAGGTSPPYLGTAAKGGAGAFVKTLLPVTAGETLRVTCGQGGCERGSPYTAERGGGTNGSGANSGEFGGGGGGFSAVYRYSDTSYLAIAGAGGGAGRKASASASDSTCKGGAGGSTAGENGSGGYATAGGGATTSAGGSAGSGIGFSVTAPTDEPTAGSSLNGGVAGHDNDQTNTGGGGGGGGGYYGGGGGGASTGLLGGIASGAGGGGGSSLYGVSGSFYSASIGGTADLPDASDADYPSGGVATGNTTGIGGDGYVKIYTYTSLPAEIDLP
jgi:hypothetical protein